MSSSKSKTAMAKSSDLQVAGKGIDDEELRRKFLIPAHLSFAMVVATRARDSEIGAQVAKILEAKYEEEAPVEPNAPLVVFVDCKGGGDRGPEIKVFLQNLISEDQLFDISVMEPFLQYGLKFLRDKDDPNAKPPISAKLRIMIVGGDGEVGKILRSFEKLSREKVLVPPIGIIPLGKGNDLSNSFGWGDSLPSAWRLAVKSSLLKAASNHPVEQLDSWGIKIVMKKWKRKKKQNQPDRPQDTQSVDKQIELPANLSKDGGVFYKYFSIGMDAQVEYDFHHPKKNNPSLAQGMDAQVEYDFHYAKKINPSLAQGTGKLQ